MSHGRKFTLLVACIFCCISSVTRADSPVAEVSRSLDDLHSWLGDDENARQWRAFLRSDALAEQLAKGSAADRAVVEQIRDIYSGNETGLNLRRFTAVRAALDKWLAGIDTTTTDLPAAVRAAKEDFRPLSKDELTGMRSRLEDSLRRLDEYLQRGGTENADAWKTELDWAALQEELARKNGPRPDELDRITALYRGDNAGLETAAFAEVRRALSDYSSKLRIAADAKLPETYSQNLDELVTKLEALEKAPTSEDLAAVARTISWLEKAGQAPQVVAAARGRFNRPNFFASASEKLIQVSFDDPEAQAKLNQPQGLRDNIMGTAIHGTVYPSLQMSVLLIPDNERATLSMQLDGGATSQNVGYNGPVTLWSTGYTQIAARKYIYLDADGVTTSGTSASCWTSTNIYSIAARCGLIEKMAWKQAAKRKGRQNKSPPVTLSRELPEKWIRR